MRRVSQSLNLPVYPIRSHRWTVVLLPLHGLAILKDPWGSRCRVVWRFWRIPGGAGVGSFPTCTCTYCKKQKSSFKLKRKHNLEKPQLHACSTFINDRKAIDSSCFCTPDVQGLMPSFH
jgi:hypothetical protein